MNGKPTLEHIQHLMIMAELVSGFQRIAQAGLAAEMGQITQQAALDEILLIGHQVMDSIKPTIDRMEKYNGTAN